MTVDGTLGRWGTSAVFAEAKRLEVAHYDGLWASEAAHDPFLPPLLTAEHSTRREVGTAIAVAFARTQLAYTADDLQAHRGGRPVLGLGGQVRPRIEQRLPTPWNRPTARMREYVAALRAIWSARNNSTKPDFRGDFCAHTLMAPSFSPPPVSSGPPGILVAAVGEAMTTVAGEVANGLMPRAFTTEQYSRKAGLPTVGHGLAKSARSRSDFRVSQPLLTATGRTEEDLAHATDLTQRQIALCGSTPARRHVLERHGWGELGDELDALTKSFRGDA
ncbi:TIGR03617 family F420-dependent LLM class oxidoreductase [Streptomyces prunicolor]|uniref:TIGR03617 family F420-dependent LLM class oxidoreductase n=1 Tax=Streptomyces prunicolor TaxID=67348 RepID=UPI0037CEBA58